MGLWMLLVAWLAGWTLIPHLLLLNKRPTSTLAWLWALLLFPGFGPALYLMIGSETVTRRRIKRRDHFRGKEHWSAMRDRVRQLCNQVAEEKEIDPAVQRLLQGLTSITQLPSATISSHRLLRNAPAFYGALKEDIKAATCDIHIETYIWRDDEVGSEFLALLIAAAKRGVMVRVLVDELGTLWVRGSYFQPLVDAGGQFSWCHTLSPLRNRYSFNLRNHRKLQVIDGKIAYIGGMNFGREYLGLNPVDGSWSDVQIRVEGTVVRNFQEIFAEDWYFATGKEDVRETPDDPCTQERTIVQVLPGGPDEEDHPMLRVNLALVATARKRLWIAAGYFVPGETIQTALQVASARGVDVRLLISQKSEHPLLVQAGRSYYEALMRRGIHIYEYDKGIEHSKYFVIDDDWTSIGSTNLDERSMRLNFELSLLTYDRGINQELAAIFEATLAESRKIDRHVFAKRSYGEKLIESALRPFSPVL